MKPRHSPNGLRTKTPIRLRTSANNGSRACGNEQEHVPPALRRFPRFASGLLTSTTSPAAFRLMIRTSNQTKLLAHSNSDAQNRTKTVPLPFLGTGPHRGGLIFWTDH